MEIKLEREAGEEQLGRTSSPFSGSQDILSLQGRSDGGKHHYPINTHCGPSLGQRSQWALEWEPLPLLSEVPSPPTPQKDILKATLHLLETAI